MFRIRNPSPYAANDTSQETPFTRAKKVHGGMMDDLISQRKWWQVVAVVSLVAVMGMLYIVGYKTGNVKSYPYVIEVNRMTGEVRAMGAITKSDITMDKHSKIEQLKEWIKNIRSLGTDPYEVNGNLTKAFYYAGPRVAGDTAFRDHLNTMGVALRVPDTSPSRRIIRVTDISVIQMTEKTFRVDWIEDEQTYQGKTVEKARWGATLTMTQDPWNPDIDLNDPRVHHNPLRIRIDDLVWQKTGN